ncbi:MAG: pentapeptide repeat-containing protein [Halothece sp.]
MNEDNALQELKDSIQRLAKAETKDFAELVKITGLDLKQDFAEADLSEIDLSGIDFSNADLSGADLSNAKLERVILVNANLENATLKNANLRSADLKGANLINANLKDANLENADLRGAYFIPRIANPIRKRNIGKIRNRNRFSPSSLVPSHIFHVAHLNLISADVKNTRFGNNFGISKAMKHKLIQRGAIFEQNAPTHPTTTAT